MSRVETIGLFEISPKQNDREAKQYLEDNSIFSMQITSSIDAETNQAVIEGIPDPEPELSSREEGIALTEHI